MNPHAKLAGKLLLVVCAMFGFGFAMVPLYDVFCDITGLNGKTGRMDAGGVAQAYKIDEDRSVTVQFVANRNQGLNWTFQPIVHEMEVHPGKIYETSYFARNNNEQVMIGQAIPSVTPGKAAAHFSKTECFCFTEQRFEAGEGRDMPVRFVIDPALPEEVEQVTLSYTFFDVSTTALQESNTSKGRL